MPPYLLFLEALGSYIRATPSEQLRNQAGSMAPVLATILPELTVAMGELAGSYPLPADQARLRLFEEETEVIEFSPKREYQKTMEVIEHNLAAGS